MIFFSMKVKCIKINPFGKRRYISNVPARDFTEIQEALHLSLYLLYGTDPSFASANPIFKKIFF